MSEKSGIVRIFVRESRPKPDSIDFRLLGQGPGRRPGAARRLHGLDKCAATHPQQRNNRLNYLSDEFYPPAHSVTCGQLKDAATATSVEECALSAVYLNASRYFGLAYH